MILEVSRYGSVVASLILQSFRHRSLSEVVIARQPGGSRQMRITHPHLIIFAGVFVSFFEPRPIRVTGGLFRLVHGHDHGSKKRRLRARQEVSPVSVQQGAIVLDLEEKVLHHAACQISPPVAQQSHDDEIAVPPIHLVEPAACIR